MWGNKASTSQGLLGSGFFRDVIGPILLMVGPNFFLALIIAAMTKYDWSLLPIGQAVLSDPVGFMLSNLKWPTPAALKVLGVFAGFELLLIRLVPGKLYEGPVTPGGNVPRYTANGFQSFIITLVAYLMGAYYFKAFNPSDVYDLYPEMLTAMTIFSLMLCVFLYFKGLYFPSSTDSGTNGNFFMDFYWGTELYPRVFGFDIKLFTNCRFGMMAWVLIPLVCAHKNMDNYGFLTPAMAVNVTLQLIYCAKVRGARSAAAGARWLGSEPSSPCSPAHSLTSLSLLPQLPPSPPAVLLLGDRLPGLHGHHARPRRLLPLLGLHVLGAREWLAPSAC